MHGLAVFGNDGELLFKCLVHEVFFIRNALHKSFKAKSQRAIRLHSCEML